MISLRLKSLLKYVDNKDKIIDIGCDHALLDIYLVKKLNLKKIIVSDIHKNALESGINNIKKYNLGDNIESRLGDGLEVLTNDDDINTIIISGMGTNTILHILNNNYIKRVNKLIIQSNRDYDILRREVIKLGFYIDIEEVIEDKGKIYINIVFLRGLKSYSEEELKYGTKNMINKDIYYDYLIQKNKSIIENIDNNRTRLVFLKEIQFLESKK